MLFNDFAIISMVLVLVAAIGYVVWRHRAAREEEAPPRQHFQVEDTVPVDPDTLAMDEALRLEALRRAAEELELAEARAQALNSQMPETILNPETIFAAEDERIAAFNAARADAEREESAAAAARAEAQRLEEQEREAEAERREAERIAAEDAAQLRAEQELAALIARPPEVRQPVDEVLLNLDDLGLPKPPAGLDDKYVPDDEALVLDERRLAEEETARLRAKLLADQEAARIEAERLARKEAAREQARHAAGDEAARIEAGRLFDEEYDKPAAPAGGGGGAPVRAGGGGTSDAADD